MDMGTSGTTMEKGVLNMWSYQKRLQFPVNITQTNAAIAQVIMSQYGGPDGEIGASMRYLSQRYAIPYNEVSGLLTDIGVSVSILHMIVIKLTTFKWIQSVIL